MRRLALLLLLSGCVHGGGDAAGGAVLAGLVLASPVAKSAQAGEKGAKKLWCGTLGVTESRLVAGGTGSDEDVVEELTPIVYEQARQAGYALHRQQIGELLEDALKVARDPAAKSQASRECHA